jgi:putative hydrolase of the HAD superfamily
MKVNQPWRDGLNAKPLHTIERLDHLFEVI